MQNTIKKMTKRKIMKKLALLCSVLMLAGCAFTACDSLRGPQGERGPQGISGEVGQDGRTPSVEISSDGYWMINGQKTPHLAIGKNGENGKDGNTLTLEVSMDGYWILNEEKTGHKAIPDNGRDGRGISSVAYDEEGNLVITYSDNTSQTVKLPEKVEHVHEWEEMKRYSEVGVDCAQALYYRVCIACNAVEWERGASDLHAWSTEYSYNGKGHWFACKNCDIVDYAAHTLNENDECTVCKRYIGRVRYTLSEDGTYAIVSYYDGVETNITIASEYEGVPVTTIEEAAFSSTDIRSIILPDTVTTIGTWAFLGCDKLQELFVSASVTEIGAGAFAETDNLTLTISEDNANYKLIDGNLYSKDGTTLYWYDGKNKAKTFTVPNTVQVIAERAFSDCFNLDEVIVSASVIKIEAGAFEIMSTKLDKVTFAVTSGWKCTDPDDNVKELRENDLTPSAALALHNDGSCIWERSV